MNYQLIGGPVVIPPTYLPPEFTNFEVLPNVVFPEGGSEESPAVSSVIQILPSTGNNRQYYLLNNSLNEIRIFLGGDAASWEADVRSPLRLPASFYATMAMSPAKMALFGWSIGGGSLTVGVMS
ncbi:MAG: hypothetical protein WBA93_19780 [Microcoleaceae cyanobacterium]